MSHNVSNLEKHLTYTINVSNLSETEQSLTSGSRYISSKIFTLKKKLINYFVLLSSKVWYWEIYRQLLWNILSYTLLRRAGYSSIRLNMYIIFNILFTIISTKIFYEQQNELGLQEKCTIGIPTQAGWHSISKQSQSMCARVRCWSHSPSILHWGEGRSDHQWINFMKMVKSRIVEDIPVLLDSTHKLNVKKFFLPTPIYS